MNEVVLVNIESGDSAVFLNRKLIYTIDRNERAPFSTTDIAVNIADALGVKVNTHHMAEPSDSYWSWKDVIKLIPAPSDVDPLNSSLPVAHWNSAVYGNNEFAEADKGKPYLLQVSDQRESHGQLFVDLGSAEGNLDDMLSGTFEVSTLDGIDGDMPTMHLHFDGDNLAASFFKQGDRFIVRPEADVNMSTLVLPNGEAVWILE